MDDRGIPREADGRLAIAHKIIERADREGIPREDVIIDALALTVATDNRAALVTLDAVQKVRSELGLNQTIGSSNVSFGLPDRAVLNSAFLALVIAAGVNCPVANVASVRPAILAVDLLLGRDAYAMRYINDFRGRLKAEQ
jgi:5-methyltetrahydrofolate--homocysteine methyltransferase